MKERPILFSGPMVRAILDGRKTQTRRVVKGFDVRAGASTPEWDSLLSQCPYGVVGDRLWVRETHRFIGWDEDGDVTIKYLADGTTRTVRALVDDFDMWVDQHSTRMMRAGARMMQHDLDGTAVPADGGRDDCWIEMPDGVEVPATPSIHMPRWASRITLEVTGVRVERLQDISEDDATAEGFEASYSWAGHAIMVEDGGTFWQGEMNPTPLPKVGDMSGGMRVVHVQPTPRKLSTPARDFFANTWRSIHGADSWDDDPWVWVVEFRRL